ncbi:MAG: tRNA (adenosine(37)-N6)-threonylcarbamoyltransferase complex dimerization subunit type 1 TsaB [Candidatus Eremiobacteraeota bacterium]|nr:tRNA (adenosine(37)-N6)-threonylcarbamoyltransferase complex dimerization subunit type 1 TsaB [Candidatus Eremiobacteraeota bacterium]
MNVVALDGAFGGFGCAVAMGGEVVAHHRVAGNVALESGLAVLMDTLAQAVLTPADIDLLAVGTGPGGFTGLRIAISYAKSLALGWRRPLVGVSTFDALEFGLRPRPELSIISARPGTSSARLRTKGGDQRFSGLTHALCDQIAQAADCPELTVVGAPEDVLSCLGERGMVVRTASMVHPPAVAIALIAASREHASSPHAVRADYGELPAAKVPATR